MNTETTGLERETGVEPATLSLGKGIDPFVGRCRHSQPVATLIDSPSDSFHSVASRASFCSPFAAPVLQGFLTVREVAALLCVSRASVYKLCAAGDLPHVRVLGAIRIASPDLAAFVALACTMLRSFHQASRNGRACLASCWSGNRRRTSTHWAVELGKEAQLRAISPDAAMLPTALSEVSSFLKRFEAEQKARTKARNERTILRRKVLIPDTRQRRPG